MVAVTDNARSPSALWANPRLKSLAVAAFQGGTMAAKLKAAKAKKASKHQVSGWAGQRRRLKLRVDESLASVASGATSVSDRGGARAKAASAQAKHRQAALPMSPAALSHLTARLDIQHAFVELLEDCVGPTRRRGGSRNIPVWAATGAELSEKD